jgi:cell fate regulator YaaT (PSP1 superfamily)
MSFIVVGVRFKQAGKIYYFDPVGMDLKPGDYVIVETARGLEYGQVMVGPREVPDDKVTLPLKNVIRAATAEDNAQLADNREREKKAIVICQEKVNLHKLDMKLVDVEYTFDRSKIIFYFTADGRVDFRELVKDLAAVFRTRIELRQIGVRDEAKMLGGLGPCGRPLCCATFLGDFEPVSIKMAKEQNLSLNPVKISGICSRLMCCLKYESTCYRETKSDIPLVGGKIRFDGREGKILANNQLKESLLVDFGNGDKREVLLSEVEEIILEETTAGCKRNCKSLQHAGLPDKPQIGQSAELSRPEESLPWQSKDQSNGRKDPQSGERSNGKANHQSGERQTNKPNHKSGERQTNKPNHKSGERQTNKPNHKSGERQTNKPNHKSGERQTNKPNHQPGERRQSNNQPRERHNELPRASQKINPVTSQVPDETND